MSLKDLPTEWEAANWGIAFFIAIIGGVVNWSNRIKKGYIHTFSLFELMGEMTTSGFVGIVSVMSIVSMPSINLPPMAYFAISGICGHFGTRLLFFVQTLGQALFDKYIRKINPDLKVYDIDSIQHAYATLAKQFSLKPEDLIELAALIEKKAADAEQAEQQEDSNASSYHEVQ